MGSIWRDICSNICSRTKYNPSEYFFDRMKFSEIEYLILLLLMVAIVSIILDVFLAIRDGSFSSRTLTIE